MKREPHSRRRLTLRKLHIIVVDSLLLAVAIIEGVKYVLFLLKK